MHLYHLVYFSERTSRAPDVLDGILSKARDNNARLGLTGALLVSEANYIQVLEGPRAVLSDRLAKIMVDPRHAAVELSLFEELNFRKFEDWSMAALDVGDTDVGRVFRYFTADVPSLSHLSGVTMWDMVEQMTDVVLREDSEI